MHRVWCASQFLYGLRTLVDISVDEMQKNIMTFEFWLWSVSTGIKTPEEVLKTNFLVVLPLHWMGLDASFSRKAE